jgi:uncharacterized protein with HEPN domain
LLGIIDSIKKIKAYSRHYKTANVLFKDTKTFDAILMNFIVIGEMVDRIDDTFKEKYSNIQWSKIKSFRNIIAHDYFGVDAEEIWDIIKNHLLKLEKDILKCLK